MIRKVIAHGFGTFEVGQPAPGTECIVSRIVADQSRGGYDIHIRGSATVYIAPQYVSSAGEES